MALAEGFCEIHKGRGYSLLLVSRPPAAADPKEPAILLSISSGLSRCLAMPKSASLTVQQ
jgi:hypothetical protein